MKENIKYFETLNDADGYIINDIPFIGYIKENGQVIFNNDPNKILIIDDGQAIIHEINIVFETLDDADGYIIETIPFTCYIKENGQVIFNNAPNKMLVIEDGYAIIHNIVDVIFETLNDADGYIIETIPFSCYIKENQQLLECNQENCKIVVENEIAVIKERGDIIRYTATRKVTPYDRSALPTIVSNDFDQNIGQGIIKFETDVENIGDWAFYNCRHLTSMTIPNSVENIGAAAFYNCSGLTSITIPDSVISIGNSAFSNCTSLTSPVYNAHVFAYMPTSYSGAYAISDDIESIAGSAFSACRGLTSITILDSVISIGNGAFSNCTGLTSIEIPDSVTSIGDNTFQYCSGLTGELIIPNSVTSIGNRAFYECTALTSVTIPNSVTSIGDYAFYNCRGLTSVTIGNSVATIGQYAFVECRRLTSITIPNSVTSIGNWAFENCRSLTSVSYTGTISQYNSITKGSNWHSGVPATQVYCLGENPPAYTPI